MPSPFPGMDPYLEGSEWVSVHAELSSEIARQLAPKLRPKYIVRTIPIPLLPGDLDSALDLQLALTTIYDALSYDLSVDYTQPPEIPLEGEAALWARQCVQAAGLLPS
jgi:hypothetical protein